MLNEEKIIQQYIKSGEYFDDSRYFFHRKYLSPFTESAYVFAILIISIPLMFVLIYRIYFSFPLQERIFYAVYVNDVFGKTSRILNASKDSPKLSVAYFLIKNYVINREKYEYNLIEDQAEYVRNNSTRLVFRRFQNFMNLENPNSPVLRYQKSGFREIKIKNITFQDANTATVFFSSKAIDTLADEVFEDMDWKAEISFESDPITKDYKPKARYGFIITQYKLHLIQNRK